MYTVVLDVNEPLTSNNYTADATNTGFINIADTVLNEQSLPYTTPSYGHYGTAVQANTRFTWGLLITERNTTYGTNDKLPVPSLKGWKFLGWYTEPQLDKGVKVTDASTTRINDTTKQIDNHILYAHWEPEVYYIKYYMNNTNKNVYGDVYTDPVAKFDTSLTGAVKSGATKYTYNASEDCYIQTVQYDHDIEVLPNYYAKTGYYFKNWSNKSDTTLTGTKGTGTGTGKQTGTTYQESTILKPIKNGENFQTLKGNFNYITNEKALASGTEDTPVWAYGDQTIIFYATWEPIKYNLRFNGTDNWNNSSSFTTGQYTNQDSYLQKVTNAAGASDTKIRYDQIFTLNANLFKREAPHTIKSPDGLSVVLKSGYGYIGWGFGKDTMKYSSNPSYKLLSMNTEHDPEQALTSDNDTTGRNYEDKQANVKNVISPAGIQKITKYISDWSNARSDSNRKDKSEFENNVIESNLHSIWRRNSNDDHINDGNQCPEDCTCPDDGNGNCTCPSDDCHDSDGDGTCDCHDPDPNNPNIPMDEDETNCPEDCTCPEDENGDCDCPSDACIDTDNDGICDCHDPDISTGGGDSGEDNDDGDPTDGNDTDNFGITLTFDLNGGYINKNNRFYTDPIVLKQELFNDYYYEFDIIGNTNKDHLNHTAVIDAYGAYSNTNTPKKNYNAYTGLNVIYNKGDGNGGLYRLSGWSTNKGAIYPDYKVTIDGIKSINLDTFDAANNANTIKICNDTTLYAVWEPVLQMNVELTNTVTGSKAKTGTLTDATQENMQRNGLPTLAVKPGQEIKYLIAIRGENKATIGSRIEPMNLTVEFDSVMTGIYNSANKDLHDGLNQIAADDIDDPNEKMLLSTTNLNRKFVKQPNKSIIRKFSIPVYLGTERAEEVGYPSFKSDGYTLNITLSRPSNFHKGDEVVTAKLILDTTGFINSSGGSGGSGGNSGGGGGTGSNLPSSTVGEFRTNIR